MDHEILRRVVFPPHVRRAIDEDKVWRAKEILRGRIGSMPYSPDLYEQYGAVLLAMQDELQAGKYLFLSGSRRPEYETAIAVFLARHGKRLRRDLLASFPAHARQVPLERFPPVVRQELIARGLPDVAGRPISAPPRRLSDFLGGAFMIGCLLLALFGVASMVAGIPIVLRALIDLVG